MGLKMKFHFELDLESNVYMTSDRTWASRAEKESLKQKNNDLIYLQLGRIMWLLVYYHL